MRRVNTATLVANARLWAKICVVEKDARPNINRACKRDNYLIR